MSDLDPPQPPDDTPSPRSNPGEEAAMPNPEGPATPVSTPNTGASPPRMDTGGGAPPTPISPPAPVAPVPPTQGQPIPVPPTSSPPADGKRIPLPQDAAPGGGKPQKPPERRDAFAQSAETQRRDPKALSAETGIDDVDPTEALPNHKRENVFLSFGNEAPAYAAQLRDHGILVVGCEHARCADGAVLELIYHQVLGGGLRVRCVTNHDYPLNSLINGSLRSRIGRTSDKPGGREVVLLFQANSVNRLEHVRNALESRGLVGYDITERFHVIIQLTGEAWRGFTVVHTTAPVWAIDARSHLLRHYKTPETEIVNRLDQIAKAQARGLLPGDQWKLMIALEQHLFAGNLAEILATADGIAPVATPNAGALARQLLDDANDVEKAALFVAATFPEMRVGEFSLLMQTLLPHLPSVEGTTRRQPARTAAEYWDAEQERLFRRLHLGHRTSLDGALLVTLTFPGLQEAIGSALFAPYQLAQVERLHSAALLLKHNTPPRIVEALIDITARLAPSFPDVFHRDWLMNQLQQIEVWGAEFAAGASRIVQAASGTQLDWSVILVQLRERHRAQYRTLLGRLAAMCRGFLATDTTAPIARGFLDDLINGTKPDCADALEVIRCLREQDARNFDADLRLRNLLDFVSVELRGEIFRDLLRRMRGQHGRPEPVAAWRTLELVASWLPTERNYDRMGESARWALAFLYSVWEDYRRWSMRHPGIGGDTPIVWLQPQPELPLPAERVAVLAAWLAHPAFCAALNHVLRATFCQRDEAHWVMLEIYFQARRFTVGEAFMAELLAGFYALSGQPELMELAELLAAKLPGPLLDKLRVLIRQDSAVSGDDLRASSKTEYPILKRRMKRAYALASHLGGTANVSPPII